MKRSAGINILIPFVLLLITSGAEVASQVVNGVLEGSVYFNESVPIQVNTLIQWTFNNTNFAQLFSGGTPVYVGQYVGRCDLSENGTLRLDNLRFADDGEYTMNAQYTNFTAIKRSIYTLKVYTGLSSPVLNSNVTNDRIINGTHMSLHCDAGSQTVTTYNFSRDGKNICPDFHVTCKDSNLNFQPITESDSGSYTCTIHNPVSTNTSNTLQLSVLVPVSAVTLTSNASESYIWAGEDSVSFHCSSKGSNVTFLWKLNGQLLPQGPRYNVSDGGPPPRSNLLITPVSRNDAGPFTCEASNRLGNEISNALSLNLGWNPERPINCTVEPVGQSVKLGCSWSGGRPAAIVFLIFGGETQNGTDNVTREVSVGGNFRGSNFTCLGDQLGRTSQCSVTFPGPEAPGHSNDTITTANIGTTLVLTVTLEPGLPANFSWYRLNPDLVPIQTNGKFSVEGTSSSSRLQIRDVTVEEAGKYVCRAENVIGSQSFFFNVTVTKHVPPTGGLSGGAIAGIVIGVLAGVALIGIAVFFIMKKKKSSGDNKRINDPQDQLGASQYATVQKHRQNGGVAETSLTTNQPDDKDDVKYAEIKFPNNVSTKPNAPPPVESEYSTVKTSTKR